MSKPLTLRGRLLLVFFGFLLSSLGIGAFQIQQQGRIYNQASKDVAGVMQQISSLLEFREELKVFQRESQYKIIDPQAAARVDRAFDRLLLWDVGGKDLRREYSTYRELVSQGSFTEMGKSYESLLIESSRLSSLLGRTIDAVVAFQQQEQARFFRGGVIALILFFLVAVGLTYRAVSIIVRPLVSIREFLDGLDMDAAPERTELDLESSIPEISRVEKSFERFFQRVHGYRDLNLKRLVFEKERADLIANSTSDGIILLNEDEIVYVNPVGERILGFAPGSLLPGQSLASLTRRTLADELVPDTPSAKGARAVLSAIARSIPVEYSLSIDDRALHFLIHARPVSSGWERLQVTTLVMAQDVSLVKESQEAKGHFLATLSHEIKTPITSLTMATRLLQRSIHQIENPTLRTLVETCNHDVDRLRGLLTDLLSISGFDTLTQKMAIQNIDLGRLLKHSTHSFKAEALEREIELVCDVRTPRRRPLVVPGDPTKISWAISNLFTNALRHTPRGGRVEIVVEEKTGWVEVRIRDTGEGIDRKRLGQIFEKFSSHYDIRVARSGGAGVGLAITREIIVAHHGRIWVTSEPAHGSEFCFTLPLVGATSEQANEFESVKGASGG